MTNQVLNAITNQTSAWCVGSREKEQHQPNDRCFALFLAQGT
ncbi:hypothetical protein OO184_19285 [Photorhabdus sp. APURE]|nr:hypothetical protein [Photorhabdus aballayi]MCW7550015.1 hypothetical protein [Photorhabdus aballayi]